MRREFEKIIFRLKESEFRKFIFKKIYFIINNFSNPFSVIDNSIILLASNKL